jgi:hypothetical protein
MAWIRASRALLVDEQAFNLGKSFYISSLFINVDQNYIDKMQVYISL